MIENIWLKSLHEVMEDAFFDLYSIPLQLGDQNILDSLLGNYMMASIITSLCYDTDRYLLMSQNRQNGQQAYALLIVDQFRFTKYLNSITPTTELEDKQWDYLDLYICRGICKLEQICNYVNKIQFCSKGQRLVI